MKDDVRVDFVVRKKPRGVVVRKLKDGTTVIEYQVTQEQMDNCIDQICSRNFDE